MAAGQRDGVPLTDWQHLVTPTTSPIADSQYTCRLWMVGWHSPYTNNLYEVIMIPLTATTWSLRVAASQAASGRTLASHHPRLVYRKWGGIMQVVLFWLHPQ
jgi:hypothetical protein